MYFYCISIFIIPITEAKQRRDAIRGTAGDETVAEAERLTRESQFMKAEQRRIKQRCAYEIEQAEDVVRQGLSLYLCGLRDAGDRRLQYCRECAVRNGQRHLPQNL